MNRRRSISTKVILSFVMVVLFQGLVSIAAVTWILSRTANITLDEQLVRTAWLVEKYFNEQAKSLQVKAKLLSGQEKLTGSIRTGNRQGIHRELGLMLYPLGLDAAFVVNSQLEVLDLIGNSNALDIAMKNGIVLGSVEGTGIILTGDGAKMHMWARNPVLNGEEQIGALYAGINLNRSFLTGMEEACNAKILLSLRRSIMVNGHLSDPVFLEYSRRSFADPGQAESGSIEHLVYQLTRFKEYKDLSAVFFLDTELTRSLMLQYTVFSIVFLILVLFVGVVMAVGLYRMSFQKPFASFQQAIRAISRGELSFRAREPGGDEFSELEQEFETMTVNLKRLEERLQISSRMAAVGEMVAGVAHQIRNPLGIMKVSVGILGGAFTPASDPEGKYRKLVDLISGEVDTLSVVINRFLDFTRPLQVRQETVDLAEFLDHSLLMAGLERWPGKSVRVNCPRGLQAWFDPSLMQQVLTNMVQNGLEASGPGGVVELGAWEEPPDPAVPGQAGPPEPAQGTAPAAADRDRDQAEQAATARGAGPGTSPGAGPGVPRGDGHPRVHLMVRDQGCGMDEATRAQVFHPFFTTKNSGTGLGLSIAHRIVEGHGGRIEFTTQAGQGTIFHIVV